MFSLIYLSPCAAHAASVSSPPLCLVFLSLHMYLQLCFLLVESFRLTLCKPLLSCKVLQCQDCCPLIPRSDFLEWCQLIAKLHFASCRQTALLGTCYVLTCVCKLSFYWVRYVLVQAITVQSKSHPRKLQEVGLEGMLTGKTELHFKQFSLDCK